MIFSTTYLQTAIFGNLTLQSSESLFLQNKLAFVEIYNYDIQIFSWTCHFIHLRANIRIPKNYNLFVWQQWELRRRRIEQNKLQCSCCRNWRENKKKSKKEGFGTIWVKSNSNSFTFLLLWRMMKLMRNVFIYLIQCLVAWYVIKIQFRIIIVKIWEALIARSSDTGWPK